ncbi:MAG TPA: DUF4224 domain-containing protein [Acidiferrobacterales bacterium]|nr:DUF4224 domain-containing protein [Acidiferrobacterales bacterium]
MSTEPNLILSHAELCAVTGRSRYRAQAKALTRLGISHRVQPDGFPLVSRAHFEEIMSAESRTRPSAITDGVFAEHGIPANVEFCKHNNENRLDRGTLPRGPVNGLCP